MAAQRVVDGRQVLVMAAVTGQPGADPLQNASDSDLALIDATATGLHIVPVVSAGQEVANVTMAWAPAVRMVVTRAVTRRRMVGSGGTRHRQPIKARTGVHARTTAAHVQVSEGTQQIDVPVDPTGPLPSVPLRWRLMHG